MSAPSFPSAGLPILVAHDLGPGGRRAADVGAIVAQILGAPLRLVHAMDAAVDADFGAIPAGIAPAADVLRSRIEARVAHERAALQAEVARLRSGGLAQVDAEHVDGRPWEAIVAVGAREGAQLVVVAAHAGEATPHVPARGIGKLLGSTAERIVRHAGMVVAVAADEPVPAAFFAGAAWIVGVELDATSRPPLETAQRLAARVGGRVLAVHATRSERVADAALREELTRFVGTEIASQLEAGPAAEAFVRAAAANDAGAVVLGVHEHNGLLARALGRDALGPTFRLTRVPVFCVPA